MKYWYIAHDDELLIDLDEYMRPTKTGCPWGEAFFRRRLRDAMASNKLIVESVWLMNSSSEKHYHAIVHLRCNMKPIERLIWQMHLGSDLYRSRADLMRLARGIDYPSLLIANEPIPKFYRGPDFTCFCTNKHKTEEQVELGAKCCPVWSRVRGLSPWELFGPSRKISERFIPLPVGEVPLELIMKVEEQP